MKPEQTEIEKKVGRALTELKRTRDELRVKMNLLGKDAGDVLESAEEVARFLETKLTDIGEAAVQDAKAAVAFVREKLDKLAAEVENRRVAALPRTDKPAEPVAQAKN
jgi:hypothetical protein